jgi:hypothetical protein
MKGKGKKTPERKELLGVRRAIVTIVNGMMDGIEGKDWSCPIYDKKSANVYSE